VAKISVGAGGAGERCPYPGDEEVGQGDVECVGDGERVKVAKWLAMNSGEPSIL